ncbi:MAG: NAD(P)-binding domain-containing protein [Cytophaga sp.]|uniref:NAD(P)-binding domain-containing protein n=1 Tax=Cytophaga sp. TaxID=29535 RepID=UPI003F800EE6
MSAAKTISILGCGWLGVPLARKLAAAGNHVKGSTTRIERLREIESAGATGFLVKAEDGKWTGVGLKEFLTCDILIIAIPPGTKRNLLSKHAAEVKELLNHITAHSIFIQKIIYISSTSVYKNANKIVTETDVTELAEADNKVLAEAEMYVLQSPIPERLVLRMGGLTGYDRMLARFFAGKTDLTGWNEPVNLVHRDDAVGSIQFMLDKKTPAEVFNVCSPKHPNRKLFYESLCAKFNLALPAFITAIDADWKEVSSEKISALGYSWIFPDPFRYSYTY